MCLRQTANITALLTNSVIDCTKVDWTSVRVVYVATCNKCAFLDD